MRKALLIIAIIVLVLTPVAAYALIVHSPVRGNISVSTGSEELTQQQLTDLQESYQKMIDLRKETITKMVQDGLLTEEQGQAELKQLDEMAAYYAENGYAIGYGYMNGCRGGYDEDDGYYGRGMMRGYRWN